MLQICAGMQQCIYASYFIVGPPALLETAQQARFPKMTNNICRRWHNDVALLPELQLPSHKIYSLSPECHREKKNKTRQRTSCWAAISLPSVQGWQFYVNFSNGSKSRHLNMCRDKHRKRFVRTKIVNNSTEFGSILCTCISNNLRLSGKEQANTRHCANAVVAHETGIQTLIQSNGNKWIKVWTVCLQEARNNLKFCKRSSYGEEWNLGLNIGSLQR